MSDFQEWAFVEIMGHRSRAGLVTEVEIAGTKMLRIEQPCSDGSTISELYGASSIFSLRISTEEKVRERGVMKIYAPPSIAPALIDYEPDDADALFEGSDDDEEAT